VIFCTLLNGRYLPQGLALYRSLEATARSRFVLYVLCMDDFSADMLARMSLPNVRIVRLEDIETEALRTARANRSFGEYCWTCTAPLMMYVQDIAGPRSVVTYADADIRFFSDPQKIFDEMGEKSIFVHEHDFAPAYGRFQAHAGRFNVGVVAIRHDPEGRACLERWHQQSVAECVMDPSAGKCGDQNYLDEWPQRYPGLVISANPGVGLAPWNIEKHRISEVGEAVMVDGVPIVFYHYHSLRVWRRWFGLRAILMFQSPYSLDCRIVRAVYVPYLADLRRAISGVQPLGMPVEAALEAVSVPRLLKNLVLRRRSLSIERAPLAGAIALPRSQVSGREGRRKAQ
jgi:hypothetical protein